MQRESKSNNNNNNNPNEKELKNESKYTYMQWDGCEWVDFFLIICMQAGIIPNHIEKGIYWKSLKKKFFISF